jgi:hypothetical protein
MSRVQTWIRKKAMKRLETQHMKFLKKLVRVSTGNCSGNYVIRKPLGEMDIVKDTENTVCNGEITWKGWTVKKRSLYRPGEAQRFPGV